MQIGESRRFKMPDQRAVLITGDSVPWRLLRKQYDDCRQRALNAIHAYEEKGPGPEVVAETLLEIVSSKSPRLRYLIGGQAKLVTLLRRWLPAGLYESGVRRTFSI